MLTKTKAGCELRRTALQIAVQLPENAVEAREVLELTHHLINEFLIPGPRLVVSRLSAAAPPPLVGAAGPPAAAAIAMTIAAVVTLSPLGGLLAYLGDVEAPAGWLMLLGAAAVSLILGGVYAVGFSILAAIGHNLFVIKPIFAFSVPTETELIRLAGLITLSLILPILARRAASLRALLFSGAAACRAVAAAAGRSPA